MQKGFYLSNLLLLLLFWAQSAHAQVTDTSATKQDLVIIMQQLVKEYLLQEIQKGTSSKKLRQNAIARLSEDSLAIAAIGKTVLRQMSQIQESSINTGRTVAAGAGNTTKQLLQEHFAKLVQTEQVKCVLSQFTGMLTQPVLKWVGGSVGIIGQAAPSLFNSGTVFINRTILTNSWTVLSIPMELQFSRQDFTGSGYHSRNNFIFHFNREAYLNSLRDKMQLKIKTSQLLPDYHEAIQKIKADAVSRLTTSLDSLNSLYKGFLGGQLAQLGDPQNLLLGDVSALRDKLLSAEFMQNLDNKKNQLAQLQQQLNTGGQADMALYESLLKDIQSVQGINAIIATIKSFKEEAQQSGLLDKLRQLEQSSSGELQQWIQDPDKLKSLVKDQLDLNGLQKIFLNMNRLQAGMNTVSLSPLTVCQYVNNGINAEFFNNKTYLFIMAGKDKEFSSLYDHRFANPLFSTDNTGMGVRVGRGDLQKNYAHFSLFSYRQNKSSYGNTLLNVLPGKTVVMTFSNQLKMNDANLLNVEISRSTHKYDNKSNILDTLFQGTNIPRQLRGARNLIQQLAFTIQWSGEVKDLQLSYDVHGTRIGKGYNNPGSLFLSGGMTEIGGNIKKNFLSNQLQLSARGNFRAYAFTANNNRWHNYNFSFIGKWKLKKGQSVSLRYQPYQSLRWQDDKKMAAGGSNRLSIDLQLRRRFGKINYQHIFSLSALKNKFSSDTVPVSNNAVLISSMQSIIINNQSYYLNLQYNKAIAPSALAFFDTQFNADAGVSYRLSKEIMASTALNYNITKNWSEQVGIKQGLSGQLGKKFTISLYADVFKNITLYRPYNMDNIRMDWSLQYLIK
ncbi:MAG: hypothetical protein ABIQ88_18385 [Chitinophagaceae bacterium]